MARTEHGWDVVDEAAGVLTREYTFTKGASARMVTGRLKNGKLVALSPACRLPDAALQELEKFGGVGALVATNGFHHLGLPSWQAAFPGVSIYAPRDAQKRILKKHPTLAKLEDLEALAPHLSPGVRVLDVPGQKMGETWLTTPTAKGPLWYVSDSCFSMPEAPKALIPRLLFKWTDSAPGFKINGLGLKLFVKDRAAYRMWFLAQLEAEAPKVVMTAHGAIVDTPDVAGELRRLAEARL